MESSELMEGGEGGEGQGASTSKGGSQQWQRYRTLPAHLKQRSLVLSRTAKQRRFKLRSTLTISSTRQLVSSELALQTRQKV